MKHTQETGQHVDRKKRDRLMKKFVRLTDFVEQVEFGAPDLRGAAYFSVWESRLLTLDGEGAREYERLVDELDNEFNENQDLSRRSVERFARDAILKLLEAKSDTSIAAKVREEKRFETLTELRARLKAEPTEYKCFIPVEGFALKDLPLLFAGIRFEKFGSSHRKEILRSKGVRKHRVMRANVPGPKPKRKWKRIWGCPVAILTVPARDQVSAIVLARKKIAECLDLLNSLFYVIPYNYAWSGLSGEARPVREEVPVLWEDGSYSINFQALGTLGPYRLDNLREAESASQLLDALDALTEYVSALSEKEASKSAGKLLITAARWYGRANVEQNRERSFLFYAIALETALLPTEGQELSYRLALRVASLVSPAGEKNREIFDHIRYLYVVRSKIVHDGLYEVSERDRSRIRAIGGEALTLLLKSRELWTLSKDELEKRLEDHLWEREAVTSAHQKSAPRSRKK